MAARTLKLVNNRRAHGNSKQTDCKTRPYDRKTCDRRQGNGTIDGASFIGDGITNHSSRTNEHGTDACTFKLVII